MSQESKGKILLMDDKETVRNVTKAMLEHLGYECVVTNEGVEAVDIYQRTFGKGFQFDMVILDLTVPGGMGGVETVKEIRAINQSVRALAYSGYCEDPVQANPEEFGFNGFLNKPANLRRLGWAISRVMGWVLSRYDKEELFREFVSSLGDRSSEVLANQYKRVLEEKMLNGRYADAGEFFLELAVEIAATPKPSKIQL